jgi:hypothetical protein
MAITKDTVIDLVQVLEDGTIQLRRARYFLEDGVRDQDSRQYHRATFTPNQALTEVPAGKLRQTAAIWWTPEIITAYVAKLAAQG